MYLCDGKYNNDDELLGVLCTFIDIHESLLEMGA